MIKNYALYLNDDNEDIEEEVNLNVNGIHIRGFAQLYSYQLRKGETYPVNLSLFLYEKDNNENLDIEIQKGNRFGIEQINKSFAYQLYGKLQNDILELGKFNIQDKQLLLFPEFNGKYIKIVARINVEFTE